MQFILAYATFILIITVAYIFKKDYISKHDFVLLKVYLFSIFKKKAGSSIIEVSNHEVNQHNHNLHSSAILLKSLRHLDFMTQLEQYLQTSETRRFKKKVLSEFEVSKLETQITVLKVAKLLSKSEDKAA